jgi:protoporphyrinogen IX oxidase
MLWVKSFHIVFIASWFAGLFYLPRIYVNLAEETEPHARSRLLLMAKRLLRFTTLLAVPALVLGYWLMAGYGIGEGSSWLKAKLVLVVMAVGYHCALALMLHRFNANKMHWSTRSLRFFNEIPVLLLAAIVILVVVKPF